MTFDCEFCDSREAEELGSLEHRVWLRCKKCGREYAAVRYELRIPATASKQEDAA